jgi:hypothetical protein
MKEPPLLSAEGLQRVDLSAKATLDVFIRATEAAFWVTHGEFGIQQLRGQLEPADFVILKAAGGLEVPVAARWRYPPHLCDGDPRSPDGATCGAAERPCRMAYWINTSRMSGPSDRARRGPLRAILEAYPSYYNTSGLIFLWTKMHRISATAWSRRRCLTFSSC